MALVVPPGARADLGDVLRGGSSSARAYALTELGRAAPEAVGSADEVAMQLQSSDERVVRGACEALAQMGDSGLIFGDAIASLLGSPSEGKRCCAAIALGRLGPAAEAQGYASQVSKLLSDRSSRVRAAALVALGSMRCGAEVGQMARSLEDAAPEVVSSAITALALVGPEAKVHSVQVIQRLKDTHDQVRAAAVAFLRRFEDLALAQADTLGSLLGDQALIVRQNVVALCSELQERGLPLMPKAVALLSHEDPRFKAAAALALGSLGPAAASQAEALATLLKDSSSDETQVPLCVAGIERRIASKFTSPACAAAWALTSLGDPSFGPDIAQLLTMGNMELIIAAATALGELGGKYEEQLEPLLEDSRPQVRAAACEALGKLAVSENSEEEVAPKLAGCFQDATPAVRVAALDGLALMGPEGCTPFVGTIKELLTDRSVPVRCASIRALGATGAKGQLLASQICRCIYDEAADIRATAAATLGELGERGAAFADEVVELMDDVDDNVRTAAIKALAKMGDCAKPYLELIEVQRDSPSSQVRRAAEAAVVALAQLSLAE